MTTNVHTPGPWGWEEANHTGVYETSSPRTLVSLSTRQYHQTDGRDLGRKHVLVPTAATTARIAGMIDAISLEIHATKADEALIAASPKLLAACEEFIRFVDLPYTVKRSDHIRYQVSAIGAARAAILEAKPRP